MKPIVAIVAGLTLVDTASVISTNDALDDAPSSNECRAIFRQLNKSGDGKLTRGEIAGNRLMTSVTVDQGFSGKGYLTEDEFTPICQTVTRGASPGSQ